jgi:hypothetical protein
MMMPQSLWGDPVTWYRSLANRNLLNEHLRLVMAQAHRAGHIVAVAARAE